MSEAEAEKDQQLALAKREKKMKVQKAMECFKKVFDRPIVVETLSPLCRACS